MARIIGVRFQNGGRTCYFDAGDLNIHINDRVIVKTSRGMELGKVTMPPIETESEKFRIMPDPVKRIATEEDLVHQADNEKRQDEAYHICKEKIREHGLEMNLVDAEYMFDNSRLIFYFTADGRVDFRSLVKDLAGIFRTRIELRQIGVRDETKILGGFGMCGRELCCSTFLSDFAPVSIKMAKEQNMSLNPVKISGLCGRLMCCLKNEAGAYEYLNKSLPRKGDEIRTKDGRAGEVMNVNILRQRVRVLFTEGDNREVEEFDAADLVFDPAVHKKVRHNKNTGADGKHQNGDQDRKNDRRSDRRTDRKPSEQNQDRKGDRRPQDQGQKPDRKNDRDHSNREKREKYGNGRNRIKGTGTGAPEGERKDRRPAAKPSEDHSES